MGDRRKRIPALLRRIGLKRRLFIGFVIVSLLPMAVLGVIMGVRLYHTIMDNYEEQSIQALGTIQYRIGIVTGAKEERINAFASDADVVKSSPARREPGRRRVRTGCTCGTDRIRRGKRLSFSPGRLLIILMEGPRDGCFSMWGRMS